MYDRLQIMSDSFKGHVWGQISLYINFTSSVEDVALVSLQSIGDHILRKVIIKRSRDMVTIKTAIARNVSICLLSANQSRRLSAPGEISEKLTGQIDVGSGDNEGIM